MYSYNTGTFKIKLWNLLTCVPIIPKCTVICQYQINNGWEYKGIKYTATYNDTLTND